MENLETRITQSFMGGEANCLIEKAGIAPDSRGTTGSFMTLGVCEVEDCVVTCAPTENSETAITEVSACARAQTAQ